MIRKIKLNLRKFKTTKPSLKKILKIILYKKRENCKQENMEKNKPY
jgi:hypothetical protein